MTARRVARVARDVSRHAGQTRRLVVAETPYMLATMGNPVWAKVKTWDPVKVAAVVAAVVLAISVPTIIIVNVLIPWMECGGITTARGALLHC